MLTRWQGDSEPDPKAALGRALREVETFLEQNDPGKQYGLLEKVVFRDGSIKWICPPNVRLCAVYNHWCQC